MYLCPFLAFFLGFIHWNIRHISVTNAHENTIQYCELVTRSFIVIWSTYLYIERVSQKFTKNSSFVWNWITTEDLFDW